MTLAANKDIGQQLVTAHRVPILQELALAFSIGCHSPHLRNRGCLLAPTRCSTRRTRWGPSSCLENKSHRVRDPPNRPVSRPRWRRRASGRVWKDPGMTTRTAEHTSLLCNWRAFFKCLDWCLVSAKVKNCAGSFWQNLKIRKQPFPKTNESWCSWLLMN